MVKSLKRILIRLFFKQKIKVDMLNIVDAQQCIERVKHRVSNKNRYKVLFVVTTVSKWKYHSLYNSMISSSYFEDVAIIVAPMNHLDKGLQKEEYVKASAWFRVNNYKVMNGESSETAKCKLDSYSPDIVFFSDPYTYVDKIYHITHWYKKALCCYSQYSFMILDNYDDFYNLAFHNLLWRFYNETEFHKQIAEKYLINNGSVKVAGYPYCDILKKNGNVVRQRKKIIWAPHHTIEQEKNKQAAFLNIYEYMRELVNKYPHIDFVFKPHPNLKPRLYKASSLGWGQKNTDIYYEWWATQENTSLHEGEYTDLFQESSALIHDSASFVLEYMVTGKPMLFTLCKNIEEYDINKLGKDALKISYLSYVNQDITKFIDHVVVKGDDPKISLRKHFTNDELGISSDVNVCDLIINDILGALSGHEEI